MLAAPKIVVFGCSHQHQTENPRESSSAPQRFKDSIDSLIKQHEILFVDEEAAHGVKTVAQTITDSLSLQYSNVDVSACCKAAIQHRPDNEFDDQNSEFVNNLESDENAKAWNLVREYHMFATVRDRVRRHPGNSLLIVGERHVQPLLSLFRAAGFDGVDPASTAH